VKISFTHVQSAGNLLFSSLNRKKLFSSLNKQEKRSSETICNESCQFKFKINKVNFELETLDEKQIQWLAGIIEADGGFYVSKKGYASCEITMHQYEIQTLHYIKNLYGGSVLPRVKAKAVRWRLHKKQHLYELCQLLNGHIRTQKTREQFEKVCQLYNMEILAPKPYCLENAWFSGFFCGDGSFSINKNNFTATISVSQKDQLILREICNIFGGTIYFDNAWKGWIWSTNNATLCKLLIQYFQEYPLHNPYKQAKMKSFQRFLGYRDRKYHLDPAQRKRLLNFIDNFHQI
jgi:hypothetical protein